MHLHVLWLDGVYSHEPGRGGVEWCQHEQVADADVALLVRRVRNRVRRKLRKMGKWPEDDDALAGDAGGDPSDGEQLLLELGQGAVHGVAVVGKRRGQRDVRIGKGTRNEPFVKGVLCANLEDFSLHAAVRVAAGNRRQLEHLCRYAGFVRTSLRHTPSNRTDAVDRKPDRERPAHRRERRRTSCNLPSRGVGGRSAFPWSTGSVGISLREHLCDACTNAYSRLSGIRILTGMGCAPVFEMFIVWLVWQS